jgi:hypothetical protein
MEDVLVVTTASNIVLGGTVFVSWLVKTIRKFRARLRLELAD